MEWKHWGPILGGICMVLFSIVLLLAVIAYPIWGEHNTGILVLLAVAVAVAGFVKVYWNIPPKGDRSGTEGKKEE